MHTMSLSILINMGKLQAYGYEGISSIGLLFCESISLCLECDWLMLSLNGISQMKRYINIWLELQLNIWRRGWECVIDSCVNNGAERGWMNWWWCSGWLSSESIHFHVLCAVIAKVLNHTKLIRVNRKCGEGAQHGLFLSSPAVDVFSSKTVLIC